MLGVNHNSIQNWRKICENGGFRELMSHKRIGFKPSVITKKEHKSLKTLLSNPSNGIQGYKELKNWYDKQYNKSIPYTTITGYCIRHFSTKIKVARKSHVKKQGEAAVTFKKNLLATWIFGAFAPKDGDKFILELTHCSSDMFQIYLDEFSNHHILLN